MARKPSCYLEGCIATNVTTFNATIPTSSFPDGYPYTLDYGLFNINPNDSEDIFHPNFAAFGGTIFNLTAATGNWSDFSYQKADYGLEQYLSSIPCSAVPCVQDCQTEFVEPYVPFPREKGEELDACVEKCRGKANPIADCVVKNATDTHSIRSSSLSTPVLGSTLTSAFTSTSALLGATTTAATATSETQDSGAKGMEVGWMLGQAIVMLMFLMD
ncbi:Fc.00g020110.m01.CDS01 [Cosmosporella sp. VM-42]